MSARRIKAEAIHGRADVIIGKQGLTNAVLEEIKRRLKKKKAIKVKLLKSAIEVMGMDRRSIAQKVAEAVNARLIGIRGRTFVILREDRRQR